jgi:hypothetical protein
VLLIEITFGGSYGQFQIKEGDGQESRRVKKSPSKPGRGKEKLKKMTETYVLLPCRECPLGQTLQL